MHADGDQGGTAQNSEGAEGAEEENLADDPEVAAEGGDDVD